MSVDLVQLSSGALGMAGTAGTATAGFVAQSFRMTSASVDEAVFVADRPFVVIGIRCFLTTAGTDAGAATAVIRKVPSGVAIASGTLLHTGSLNLKGTAVTTQTLTVSTTASDLLMAAGDALAIDFTGVLTSVAGAVTISLAPA